MTGASKVARLLPWLAAGLPPAVVLALVFLQNLPAPLCLGAVVLWFGWCLARLHNGAAPGESSVATRIGLMMVLPVLALTFLGRGWMVVHVEDRASEPVFLEREWLLCDLAPAALTEACPSVIVNDAEGFFLGSVPGNNSSSLTMRGLSIMADGALLPMRQERLSKADGGELTMVVFRRDAGFCLHFLEREPPPREVAWSSRQGGVFVIAESLDGGYYIDSRETGSFPRESIQSGSCQLLFSTTRPWSMGRTLYSNGRIIWP